MVGTIFTTKSYYWTALGSKTMTPSAELAVSLHLRFACGILVP